jgi:hypothetical protein
MKLKADTKYLSREGEVVGPLQPRDHAVYEWLNPEGQETFTSSGEFLRGRATEYDLIFEVVEANPNPNPWKRATICHEMHAFVEVMFESGDTELDHANKFDWKNIVAFRYLDKPALTTEERLARIEQKLGL